MIEVRNVHKSYGSGKTKHEVLKGINLTFRENEFVAILGPSGSGKTTLLNVIGVITYISVLERRKEIGILRAMGASKHNVAQDCAISRLTRLEK